MFGGNSGNEKEDLFEETRGKEKYKVVSSRENQKRPGIPDLFDSFERATGIEPASSAWKADIIATIRRPLLLFISSSA